MRGLVTLLAATVLLSSAALAGTTELWTICRSQDYAKAIRACTSLSENTGPDTDQQFKARFFRGIAYYEIGDYDRAITDENVVVRLVPDIAAPYLYLGLAYYSKGEYDRAIAANSEAIRLEPNNAGAFNNRGMAYQKMGDYDHAIADQSQAIRLNPNSFESFHNRGIAYHRKGDERHAIADFTNALRLAPTAADVFVSRGNSYAIEGESDRAIADYNEAIRLIPDFAIAFINRGLAYDLKGDFIQAIADETEAIRLAPSDAQAFINRGMAFDDKGEYHSAISDYNVAVSLKPDDPVALHNRGLAFLHNGDYDQAVADFDKAHRVMPNDATSIAFRGVARWQLGHQEEAIADLEQALMLDPSYDYARTKLNEFQNTIEAGKARRRAGHIAGRRVALVIGNSDYRFLPKLPNAVHDAEAVRDALVAQGYDVTFLRDLPLVETVSALDRFRKNVAPSAEKALIWYTGHGQSFQVDDKASKGAALQSDNFILPIDFKTGDDVVQRGIVLGNVINGVLPAGSVQVVIIDACRSIGEKGASVGFKGTAKPTAPAPGIEPLTSNLVVVYSTQQGHSSSDGIAGQHSPFAQAFIAQLKEGGAQNDLRAFFLSVGTVTNNNAAAIGKEQVPDVTSYIATPKLVTLGPTP